MPYIPDSGGNVRDVVDAIRRASKEAAVRNVWPSARQIAMGSCLYGESLREDVALWAKKLRLVGSCDPVLEIADLFVLSGDPTLLGRLPDAQLGADVDADDHLRRMIYALAASVRPEWLNDIRGLAGQAPLALAWTHGAGSTPLREWTRTAQERRVVRGIAEMATRAGYLAMEVLEVELAQGVEAEGQFARMLDRLAEEGRYHGIDLFASPAESAPTSKLAGLSKPVADDDGAQGEDLDPGSGREGSEDLTAPAPAKVVLRRAVRPGSASKELFKACEGIVGKPLPLRAMPDGVFSALVAEWPHAAQVVGRMLGRQRLGATIRLKPTLLVGRPGSGKTALATTMGRLLGLEPTVYPCGGASDNSFGGTASRWASAGLSAPGEAIRRTGIANPLVVLDEIEKAGTSRNHGRLEDCLLPMLERHTAEAYLEVGLDMQIDLSSVNFVATANTLQLSAPLLDRFDVIEMPDPGPEHVGTLVRRIVDDLARERDEQGFVPPLAPDEMEIVAEAWGGGSLRRLRRAVEALIETREVLEARQ